MEHLSAAKRSPSLPFAAFLAFLLLATEVHSQTKTCRQRPMDIVFIVDGSRSVRPANFKIVQDAVKRMVDGFETLSPDDTQIGLIQYSSRVRQEFPLNRFYTKEAVKQAINDMTYLERGTMTGEALKYLVTRTMTKAGGARMVPEVLKVAVVITDGRSQDKTVPIWQQRAKDAGIVLFAIGIGRRISEKDLLLIASEPKKDHKFYVKDFKAFKNIRLMLTEEICDFDPCGDAECEFRCEVVPPSGFHCVCPPGKKLNRDEITCKDVVKKAPVPQDLTFSEITHTSMKAKWSLDDPERADSVKHYVVVYYRTDGEGEQMTVETPVAEAVLESLEPGTEYTVHVSAVTDIDFSPSAEGKESTLDLGETDLTLSDPSLTTLTARWQPAGGDQLSGYSLRMTKVADASGVGVSPDQNQLIELGPDTHEHVVRGLEPGTRYEGVVTPMHGKLSGGPGQDTETTKKLTPPRVTIPSTTLSTLDVDWTDIGADAGYYTITAQETGVPEDVAVVRADGEDRSTTLFDLTPDTDYTVTVVGHVTEEGQTFNSPPGTAEGRTDGLTPPDVDITKTTLSTADVMWTNSGTYPQSYTVSYCPTGRPEEKKTIDIEDISTRLTDLEPGTEYMVEVVGHSFDDDKKFTGPPGSDTDTTKSLTAPAVRAKPKTLTSSKVTWGEVGMPVDHYLVTYNPVGSPEEAQSIPVNGNVTATLLKSLDHDTEYEVSVVGVVLENDKVFNSPAGKDTFTLGAIKPPVVKIPQTTETTLDASWTDEIDADDFVLLIERVDGEEEPIPPVKVSGEVSEITFPSLTPGTEYRVTVVAQVLDEGTLLESPPGSAQGITKPAPPQNVRVTDNTPTTVTVTFDPSEGGSDWYEAKCVPTGGNPDDYVPIRVEKSDLTFTCEELTPGVTYDVYVETVFRELNSDPAKTTTQTVVGPPLNFDLSEPTTHTILATWEPPEDVAEVTEYIISYGSPQLGTVEEIRVPGTDTKLVLSKLHPDTLYDGSIRAVFSAFVSPRAYDSETTLPDDITLMVTDVGYSNISVAWPRSKVPHVVSYVLTYVPQPEDERAPENTHLLMTVMLGPDETTYVIMNAIPATIYDITIQSVYPRGQRSNVARATASTLAPPPGPITFNNITTISFIMEWEKPEYRAEPVGYSISYIPYTGETVVDVEVPSGGVLYSEVTGLTPDTLYNVSVVANYHYDIISEPTVSRESTLQLPPDDYVGQCGCDTYVRTQNDITSTLARLVDQIGKLNAKIERMEAASIAVGGEEGVNKRYKRGPE